MPPSYNRLDFAWWNVQSLAHFDKSRARLARWPGSKSAYKEKCRRVDAVLRRLIELRGCPQLIGLAEITNTAACELRDRLAPGFSVCSLDLFPSDSDFHVAVLYQPGSGLAEHAPLAVPLVPSSTRPMAVVDFVAGAHHIRFIACHWNARFGSDDGSKVRTRLAHFLSSTIYSFLHESPSGVNRHVVVIGDMNAEPFGYLEDWHDMSRHRNRARQTEHFTDKSVGRVRLYNCAWRWMGEKWPHTPSGWQCPSIGGTYFNETEKEWFTFDHVLVTGGLLTRELPALAESDVDRFVDDTLLDKAGQLSKFDWNRGKPNGVSDHLPIVGRILY